jgi:hypothetical protein
MTYNFMILTYIWIVILKYLTSDPSKLMSYVVMVTSMVSDSDSCIYMRSSNIAEVEKKIFKYSNYGLVYLLRHLFFLHAKWACLLF